MIVGLWMLICIIDCLEVMGAVLIWSLAAFFILMGLLVRKYPKLFIYWLVPSAMTAGGRMCPFELIVFFSCLPFLAVYAMCSEWLTVRRGSRAWSLHSPVLLAVLVAIPVVDGRAGRPV